MTSMQRTCASARPSALGYWGRRNVNMKTLIQCFLDILWLIPAAVDQNTEKFIACLGLPDGIWSYCMLVWIRLAKDA